MSYGEYSPGEADLDIADAFEKPAEYRKWLRNQEKLELQEDREDGERIKQDVRGLHVKVKLGLFKWLAKDLGYEIK